MVDHDRLKGHNWVSDGFNNLLLWDNGLSFNHGALFAGLSPLRAAC